MPKRVRRAKAGSESPQPTSSQMRALSRRSFMEGTGKLFLALALRPALEPPAEAIIVDDGNGVGRFERFGPNLWWLVQDGQNGLMWYTYNTDFPPDTPTNGAEWESPELAAGQYRVFAYIPHSGADTIAATYRVTHADGDTYYIVNQLESHGKWVELGTYRYEEGQKGLVYLDDVVAETVFKSTRIAFDAILWLPEGIPWDEEPDLLLYDRKWAHHGKRPYVAYAGDPVSTATGSYYHQHLDLFVPGRGLNVEFRRTYNSGDPRRGSFGPGWSFTYDISALDRGNGEIIVNFPDGRAALYVPEGDGYTTPDGFFAQLTKDGDHLVLTDADQVIYTFRPNGRLESIRDLNGNEIRLQYDDQGFTLTDTVGRTFRATINMAGLITEITDPIGRKVTYDYEGDLLSVFHDPMGGTIRYFYDGSGHLERIVDQNGVTFLINHYDDQGRVDWQDDANGSRTTFSYQDDPRSTTVTDPEGHTTVYEYDEKYRLRREVDALGRSMLFDYDADHNRIYVKDREGHETFMEYDERGNLKSIKDALGQITSFDYNPQNRLTIKRDASGAETHYEYDGTGINLTLMRDAEQGETRMSYLAGGLLDTLTDLEGHVTRFTYNSFACLETVKDAEDATTSLVHDDVSRRTATIDANNHRTELEYLLNDLVKSITDPKGNSTSFAFDLVGNLIRVTDRRGFTTGYEYYLNNALKKVIDARGNEASFTYDRMYHRRTFTNRRGFTTEYRYNQVYDLVEIVDAKGHSTRFEYDADHLLIQVTDAEGNITRYQYDALHRLTQITDANGGITRFDYDEVGRVKSRRDPNDAVTGYEYDRLGRLLLLSDALSHQTGFKYDKVGNLRELVNARGFSTLYGYDTVNRLIEQIDPMGHVTRWEYDGVGNVIALVDRRGNRTRFEYDENDNLQNVTDALNGEVAYTYDQEDNPVTVTDQNGNAKEFSHNELGALKTVKLPLGQVTEFEYDPNGNQAWVRNAKGNTTYFDYDELDLLSKRADPLGHETLYTYDPLRRLKQLTDAESHSTLYRYYPLGWLSEVEDAKGFVTRYQYDFVGNLRFHIDARGNSTEFKVDLLGRVTDEIDPENNHWHYEYDEVGNLARRVDANGDQTDYVFDKDNLLIEIHYPSGPVVRFEYDENHNLIHIADASGEEWFDYDALNRLAAARRAGAILAGLAVGYAYDKVGNRTQVVYPDAKTVRYNYNPNDWLVEVTDPLNSVPTWYERDDLGLPIDVFYPNDTATHYEFDAADRLVKLINYKPSASTDIISSFEYTLDRVGNRRQIVEKLTRGQIVTWVKEYDYDALYRLVNAVETPDTQPFQELSAEFEYDEVGNRLSMTTNIADQPNTPALGPPITLRYEYDKANRMKKAGVRRFEYYLNGTRKLATWSEREIEYAYDFENRLTGAKTFDVQPKGKRNLDATLDFTYDALGRRRQRGVKERGVRKTEDFLYDALGYDLIAEYLDPSKPVTTYYYRDPLQALSRHEIQGKGVGLQYFYHPDGLGSVSAWSNQAGRSVKEYRYAPYGRLLDNNPPDNASNQTEPHNPLTFSGKPWDKETELYHFGARDYDSWAGVWVGPDPYRGRLMEPMTLHRTMYVQDNPLNWIDQYGFDPQVRMVARMSRADWWYLQTAMSKYVNTGFDFELPTGISASAWLRSAPLILPRDMITEYVRSPHGLRWDAGIVAYEGAARLYWGIYPWLDANRVTVLRQTPNLTPYSRTKPGVWGRVRNGLAALEAKSIVGIKAPKWNSAPSVLTVLGIGLSAREQYLEDLREQPDLTADQRWGRVAVDVTAGAGIALASVLAAGIVGTLGAPVIVGAVVGLGVGYLASLAWEKLEQPVFERLGFE